MEPATITNPAATDLLAIFDHMAVKPEQTITTADLEHCQWQQNLLYATLDQIDRWHNIFRQEAAFYEHTHSVKFAPDGTVTHSNPELRSTVSNYARYEFRPFEAMNELAKSRIKAIQDFGRNIVSYFNTTYKVSVPEPELNKGTIPIDFRPVYQTYVDLVSGHLGGRGFQEVAQTEIIERLKEFIILVLG